MIKTLRQATVTALTGNVSATVYDSRITPTQLENLPAVIVFNDQMQLNNVSPIGFSGPIDISLQVDLIVSMNAGFADALDDLTEAALTVLQSDAYTANWETFNQINLSYKYVYESERPLAICSMTLSGTVFP